MLRHKNVPVKYRLDKTGNSVFKKDELTEIDPPIAEEIRQQSELLSAKIQEEFHKKGIECKKDLAIRISKDIIYIVIPLLILPGKKITTGIIAAKLAIQYGPEITSASAEIANHMILQNAARLGRFAEIAKDPAVQKFATGKVMALAKRIRVQKFATGKVMALAKKILEIIWKTVARKKGG